MSVDKNTFIRRREHFSLSHCFLIVCHSLFSFFLGAIFVFHLYFSSCLFKCISFCFLSLGSVILCSVTSFSQIQWWTDGSIFLKQTVTEMPHLLFWFVHVYICASPTKIRQTSAPVKLIHQIRTITEKMYCSRTGQEGTVNCEKVKIRFFRRG